MWVYAETGGRSNQSKGEHMKHLRWVPKPCSLGVSGSAKLVENYNDEDRFHKGSIASVVESLEEFAIVRNYQITKEQLISIFDEAMLLKRYKP